MKRDNIIAPEGYPFIVFSLVITVFVAFLGGNCWLIIVFALITFFIIWFFRNPERYFQNEEKVLISPADGKVIKIENVEVNGTISGRFKKISIFMNVFNVHVNRVPYDGKIEAIHYHEGKFFSANLDKASLDNERNEVMIRTEDGRAIWTVQIAGLIARRIVCWVSPGTNVRKGERFGLIRFGSRVDIYLPEDSRILVKLKDKVKAGQTLIGYLS
ncbi:MAG: phosphatidylserine decarboxylase family protein [Deltaproteobacteria bacterium HGW-Deltaproteobacteria-7]|jgi:phosphatidylserine decarboxylase|nr:MAG: phosphatidylserine decarboxylase family protein [Deltaproteobacteria bacterium HGW-Deltaproteobacteria-7]PKN51988.1 MAG: phosphatidylserine decarboxylase family protein [Deltaproteobacteria bacterium HGW-Deltaproteobacteria-13]